jgi:hypothetical protein
MSAFTYSSSIAKMLETRRAHKNTPFHIFSEEANHLIQSDPSGGFRTCAPLLENLCRTDAFGELVNDELDRLLNQPDYALPGSSDENLLVWTSPNFTLVLRTLISPQRQDRLFGHTCDMILAPLNPSGITLSRYHQPQPYPNDILDKSRHLTFKGDATLAFGQSSFFAACEDIFLIRSAPQEADPPLLAILITPDKFQIRWEYDSTTLAPVRAIAADISASRIEFVISLMSTMNDLSALPVLEELSSFHPAHFVRWAAVQAMFRLDRNTGMQALHRALNDPHEHVRTAASRSVAKIANRPRSKANQFVVCAGSDA